MNHYVCPECGQDHIQRAKRDQATPEGAERPGCWLPFVIVGSLVVWAFLLGAIVPAIVNAL